MNNTQKQKEEGEEEEEDHINLPDRIGSDRSAIRPRRDASAVTSVRHPKVAAFIPPFPVCTATQAG